LTPPATPFHTDFVQLSGNNGSSAPLTLLDLRHGEQAVLGEMEVPEDMARRLMELGFLPGGTVRAGRSAPGGDPRVFEVDGSEIALRMETAAKIRLVYPSSPPVAAK
jgi:ferrous iron transport protein A